MSSTAAMFPRPGFPYNPNPDVVPNCGWRWSWRRRPQRRRARRSTRGPWRRTGTRRRTSPTRRCCATLAADVVAGAGARGAALEDRAFAPLVDASTRAAHQAGINAVPAFVVDRRVLVLGAQPHEVLGGRRGAGRRGRPDDERGEDAAAGR